MGVEELGQSVSQNAFDSVNNIIGKDVVLGAAIFLVFILFLFCLVVIWRLLNSVLNQQKSRTEYENTVHLRFSQEFNEKRSEMVKQYEDQLTRLEKNHANQLDRLDRQLELFSKKK